MTSVPKVSYVNDQRIYLALSNVSAWPLHRWVPKEPAADRKDGHSCWRLRPVHSPGRYIQLIQTDRRQPTKTTETTSTATTEKIHGECKSYFLEFPPKWNLPSRVSWEVIILKFISQFWVFLLWSQHGIYTQPKEVHHTQMLRISRLKSVMLHAPDAADLKLVVRKIHFFENSK